ncbi:MAG: A/G-specific adenine glycosylase [Bdellovibrionota bacterium]
MNKREREKNTQLITELLRWFKKFGRDLPWRHTRDPYEIWISEVILQQTQVSRGIDYYVKFLERFPSVEHLASARWPSVLRMWRGLGYYHRAKNLMKTAKILVRDFDGKLPQSTKELRLLPGIGAYTASAIRSFAFRKQEPAIDTNLSRIIQRVFGCPATQVAHRAEALFQLRPRSSRTLNYALMDLGALVCKAQSPRCGECPFASSCHYRQNIDTSAREEGERKTTKKKTGRKKRARINVAVGCIRRGGEYLLAERHSSKGGGWEFPGGKCESGESVRETLKRELREELGIEVSVRPAFHVEQYSDDAFEWRIYFCRCQILSGRLRRIEHKTLKWVAKSSLSAFDMPNANRAAVEKLAHSRS